MSGVTQQTRSPAIQSPAIQRRDELLKRLSRAHSQIEKNYESSPKDDNRELSMSASIFTRFHKAYENIGARSMVRTLRMIVKNNLQRRMYRAFSVLRAQDHKKYTDTILALRSQVQELQQRNAAMLNIIVKAPSSPRSTAIRRAHSDTLERCYLRHFLLRKRRSIMHLSLQFWQNATRLHGRLMKSVKIWQHRKLGNCFIKWKTISEMALQRRNRILSLGKRSFESKIRHIFAHWRHTVKITQAFNRKHTRVQYQRKLGAFVFWKFNYMSTQRLQQAECIRISKRHEKQSLRRMIQKWRVRASRRLTLRQILVRILSLLMRRQKQVAFRVWIIVTIRRSNSLHQMLWLHRHRECNHLKSCLRSWIQFVQNMAVKRMLLKKVVLLHEHKRLHHCLIISRQTTSKYLHIRERIQQASFILRSVQLKQRKFLMQWAFSKKWLREFVQRCRDEADALKAARLEDTAREISLSRIFINQKRKCLRKAWKLLERFYFESTQHNYHWQKATRKWIKLLTLRTFTSWQIEARENARLRKVFTKTISQVRHIRMQTVLNKWVDIKKNRVSLRKIFTSKVSRIAFHQKVNVLNTWIQYCKNQQHDQENQMLGCSRLLRIFKRIYFSSLQRAWSIWKQKLKRVILIEQYLSNKSLRFSLDTKSKAFKIWKQSLLRSRKIINTCKNMAIRRNQRSLGKAVSSWKQFKLKSEMRQFQIYLAQLQRKHALNHWKRKCAQSAFRYWKITLKQKKHIQYFMRIRMQSIKRLHLRRAWQIWAGHFIQEYLRLETDQMNALHIIISHVKHHQKCLTNSAFKTWFAQSKEMSRLSWLRVRAISQWKNRKLRNHLEFWRVKCFVLRNQRILRLSRAFRCWNRLVSARQHIKVLCKRLTRIISGQKEKQLLKAFSIWCDKVKVENAIEKTSSMNKSKFKRALLCHIIILQAKISKKICTFSGFNQWKDKILAHRIKPGRKRKYCAVHILFRYFSITYLKTLAHSWQLWIIYCSSILHARQKSIFAEKSWRKREKIRTFRIWMFKIKKRMQIRLRLQSIVLRLKFCILCALNSALSRWQTLVYNHRVIELANNQISLEEAARVRPLFFVVRRALSKRMSQSWAKWKKLFIDSRNLDALARIRDEHACRMLTRTLSRIIWNRKACALQKWHLVHRQVKEDENKTHVAILTYTRSMLIWTLQQWRTFAKEKVKAHVARNKSIHFVRRKLLSLCFSRWQNMLQYHVYARRVLQSLGEKLQSILRKSKRRAFASWERASWKACRISLAKMRYEALKCMQARYLMLIFRRVSSKKLAYAFEVWIEYSDAHTLVYRHDINAIRFWTKRCYMKRFRRWERWMWKQRHIRGILKSLRRILWNTKVRKAFSIWSGHTTFCMQTTLIRGAFSLSLEHIALTHYKSALVFKVFYHWKTNLQRPDHQKMGRYGVISRIALKRNIGLLK